MNNYDTLKFSIPLEKCDIKNKKLFNIQSTFSNETHLESRKLILNKFFPGIKNITINQLKERVVFELSAKILLNEYFKGINSLNFKKICEIIRDYQLCYLFYKNALNYSTVFRADVTSNIPIKYQISNYILALSSANTNTGLFETTYKNESIVFVNNPLSRRKRLRFIFYDKIKELKYEKLPEIKQCSIDFKGTLRMEASLNNFELIRSSINEKEKGDVCLLSLFDSKENINHNLFEHSFIRVKNKNIRNDLLESSEKLYMIEKEYGRFKICNDFNFDFPKIKNFIRSKVKGNLNAYFQSYKKICEEKKPQLNVTIQKNLIHELYLNLKKVA